MATKGAGDAVNSLPLVDLSNANVTLPDYILFKPGKNGRFLILSYY
jgi:hypothetical protein